MTDSIILCGGAFDPVHNGHLIVARAIAEEVGGGRITLVPAGQSPHKNGSFASAMQRLEMLRLATAGEEAFDICDIELSRRGPSYTFDTLGELRRRHGPGVRLRWVIGADMLEDLPKWHRVGEVLEMCEMIVAVRPPWDRRLDELFSSLESRLGIERVNSLRRCVLSTPLVAISSTDIRRRITQGLSIRYLVPDAVRQYIVDSELYR